MEIKILGTGCARCRELYDAAAAAVAQAGIQATLTRVEKLDEIAAYGVVFPPALVIDEQLRSAGKIPKPAQLVQWLSEAAGQE